jgi:hypothetical protein
MMDARADRTVFLAEDIRLLGRIPRYSKDGHFPSLSGRPPSPNNGRLLAGKRLLPEMLTGRALHLRLFGYFKGIIDFYAQVAHGTLELGMPKEQLNGAEVLGPPIDQRCLGSAHSMGAIGGRI